MSKITFIPNQSLGHYYPTFKLAKQLKQREHDIVYAGEERFRQLVDSQGFSFYELDVKPFRELKLRDEIRKRSKHFLGFLWFNLLSNFTRARRIEAEEKIIAFDRFVQKERPDLFILDIFLSKNICFMHRYGIKVIIAQIFYPTDRAINYPPINSTLVPDGSDNTQKLINKEWEKTFRNKILIRTLKKILYFGQDYESIQKQLAKKYNIPLERLLDKQRSHHNGLKEIPELIFSSKMLDFPKPLSLQQYYLGSKVDFSRKNIDCDPHYERFLIELEQHKNKKWIYCSLGTLSMTHNSKSGMFLKKVIEAFRDMPDCHLILTTGRNIKIEYFKDIPTNVNIFSYVPQLEVLGKVDMMITHGGSNSVEEAILSGVPLLSYSTNSKWDQNGNTARILYHQLGMKGNIKNATSQSIRNNVIAILNNAIYKQNALKMKQKILQSNEGHKALEMILQYLEKPVTLSQKDVV